MNTDGSLDSSLSIGTGFNFGSPSVVAVQSDGKIIVGGSFAQYKGLTQTRMARITSTGALDATFVIGTGFDSTPYGLALQSDGKILVVGPFTAYKGLTQKYIARLNTDGSLDSSFVIDVGFDALARSLIVQPDGKILVSGNFSQYKGLPQSRIVRLNPDGSVDPSFSIGTGFDTGVLTMKLQPDGKIVVGGGFTSYNGVIKPYVARLNSDGSLDTSFSQGRGFDGNVNSIAIRPDGNILTGGIFTLYGAPANRIVKIAPTNIQDTSFVTGSGFNGTINTIATQKDNKILVGGVYNGYNGITRNYITRLNPDGSLDTSFAVGSGFNGSPNYIKIQNDGKILVGGTFTTYQGITQNRIVRINPDGSLDSSFAIGSGFGNSVYSLEIQPDGKILVGGAFITYKGISQIRMARLNPDGSLDSSFAIGSGFGNIVNSIKVRPDGKILVGGFFPFYNGVSQNDIALLNADGSLDSSFAIGTGFNGAVRVVTLRPDGKILVGGSFTTYKDLQQNYIALLNIDGTLDSSFAIGTGFDGSVYDIAIQPDGTILVGGYFTTYKGISQYSFVRLDNNGSVVDGSKIVGFGVSAVLISNK